MILETAIVELGRTLGLEECALWMPSRTGLTLSSIVLETTAFALEDLSREAFS